MAMVIRADATALPSLRSAIQQEFKQLDPTLPVANYRTMPELYRRQSRGLVSAHCCLACSPHCTHADRHRAVRRSRLRSQSTDARNRHPHGAGRATAKCVGAGHPPGMQPAIVGLGIGMAGAFVLMRLLTTQLYEIKPTDPATSVMLALGLLFVSLVACYIPARRATKVDPLTALRHE